MECIGAPLQGGNAELETRRVTFISLNVVLHTPAALAKENNSLLRFRSRSDLTFCFYNQQSWNYLALSLRLSHSPRLSHSLSGCFFSQTVSLRLPLLLRLSLSSKMSLSDCVLLSDCLSVPDCLSLIHRLFLLDLSLFPGCLFLISKAPTIN